MKMIALSLIKSWNSEITERDGLGLVLTWLIRLESPARSTSVSSGSHFPQRGIRRFACMRLDSSGEICVIGDMGLAVE
jgi:hypothetical protein